MHKVLIIDDDPVFARMLSRALGQRNFETSVAHNLFDAESLAQEMRPDVVLLDLNLSGRNGLQFIGTLNAIGVSAKVILLSAYGNPRTAARAVREGAVDFLAKPVDGDEIEFAIQRALNTRPPVPQTLTTPEEVRRVHIVELYERNDRNVSLTARMLGMHRRTLQRILDRESMPGGRRRRRPSQFTRTLRLARIWTKWLSKGRRARASA